jgi:glycyl-tRNA synthetase beta chain
VIDRDERRQLILTQAGELAAAENLVMREDPGLLEEVVGLVEWPVVHIGKIDSTFMAIPAEVLITVMRLHQRYFSLTYPDGTLAPRFLVVSNTETKDGGTTIVEGNQRVLRARLADAKFFWDHDRKTKLADYVPALVNVTFHTKLGTMAEKAIRLQALATKLAVLIAGPSSFEVSVEAVRNAAVLAKADLVTKMVGEFPELQGIIGQYYALHDGYDPAIAEAIAQHYSPLGPNDTCPTAPVAVLVALADKIDTLVGFVSIGEKPTGSRDPFALRRAALGVIRLILENKLRLHLLEIFNISLLLYPHSATSESVEENVLPKKWTLSDLRIRGRFWEQCVELLVFFSERLKSVLRGLGIRHDLIDAVFNLGNEDDLVRLLARVRALSHFIKSPDGADLLTAYRRASNVVRIEQKKDQVESFGPVVPSRFSQPEEKWLYVSLSEVKADGSKQIEAEDFSDAIATLAKLRVPVDTFFDKVVVNADDPILRRNRLAILSEIVDTMNLMADFSKVEGLQT